MLVRFEPDRVVAVWAPGQPTGMVGSGYRLGDGLVLTAGHVVDHADGRACEVRPLGTREWLATERVWRGGHCDAALLRAPGADRGGHPAELLGQVGGKERVGCRALGFPFAQARAEGEVRDTEDLAGEIAPLTGRESELLTVHIAGSVPTADRSGHSPWEGMSGAALFSGPLIVGVIVVDPARFGTDRLEAVPITGMLAEPDFREALTGDRAASVALAAVEDVDLARGTLDAPYRPLPAEASPTTLREGATAFLLEPKYGIVPFHGREDELGELERWCAGDGRLLVRLLCGRGGTGKTRLAAELCRRQQAAGAVAGFLTAHAAERISNLARITAPLLVIIDEAQSNLGPAAVLISELARVRRAAPARVLLLARQPGEWWPTSLEDQLDDPDARFALAAGALPCELTSVEQGPREETFLAAVHAFAGRLGRPPTNLRVADLSAPVFETIFFVHLAALSLVEGEAHATGVVVADDLLAFALRREARYWASTARAHDLTDPRSVLEQAVAVATLTTASTLSEAARALTALPDLEDARQAALRNIARWLRDVYPLPPTPDAADADANNTAVVWFRPLVPDLLGEALVAAALAEDQAPELASDLLHRAGQPEQIYRILTVLTQASRAHRVARRALRQSLADHLSTVWATALTVAQQVGDPLGSLLADVLEDQPNPELAAQIEGSLPEKTVALRELAEVATRQALEHTIAESPAPERDARVAQLLNSRSSRLSDLRRWEAALEAIDEAVGIYRELAKAHPDAFRPDLAGALNNQSNRLGDLARDAHRRRLMPVWLGRLQEALDAIDEAVDIYRELAKADPDAFLPGLAGALGNQSVRRADREQPEAALEAIDEAVGVYRQLATARPDAFLPSLAGSLGNQSSWRAKRGRHEEALDAIDEAVGVFRQLAEAHPDAFLPDLARALSVQSDRLGELGQHGAALDAIDEAVGVYRQLAKARPDVFLRTLARDLNTQSHRLGELGRHEAALDAIDEAVGVYRQLAKVNPAFLADLARSLIALDGQLRDQEQWREALTVAEEVANLAEANPEYFATDSRLLGYANSLMNLADGLRALGRTDEALAASEQAVRVVLPPMQGAGSLLGDHGLSLVQRYIETFGEIGREPGEELLQRMYAALDEGGHSAGAYNLGVLLERRGDLEGAEAAYRRADEREHPAGALGLGVLLERRGDLEGAEAAFRRADQHGDADGAFNLGVMLQRRQDLEGAEAAYRRADERGHRAGA
jgi:tetratricopeptide (TPR) repeat protein